MNPHVNLCFSGKTAQTQEENPSSAWWLDPNCQQPTALGQSWRGSCVIHSVCGLCWQASKAVMIVLVAYFNTTILNILSV